VTCFVRQIKKLIPQPIELVFEIGVLNMQLNNQVFQRPDFLLDALPSGFVLQVRLVGRCMFTHRDTSFSVNSSSKFLKKERDMETENTIEITAELERRLQTQIIALKTLLKVILAHPTLIDLAPRAIALATDDVMNTRADINLEEIAEIQAVYAECLDYVQSRLAGHV